MLRPSTRHNTSSFLSTPEELLSKPAMLHEHAATLNGKCTAADVVLPRPPTPPLNYCSRERRIRCCRLSGISTECMIMLVNCLLSLLAFGSAVSVRLIADQFIAQYDDDSSPRSAECAGDGCTRRIRYAPQPTRHCHIYWRDMML